MSFFLAIFCCKMDAIGHHQIITYFFSITDDTWVYLYRVQIIFSKDIKLLDVVLSSELQLPYYLSLVVNFTYTNFKLLYLEPARDDVSQCNDFFLKSWFFIEWIALVIVYGWVEIYCFEFCDDHSRKGLGLIREIFWSLIRDFVLFPANFSFQNLCSKQSKQDTTRTVNYFNRRNCFQKDHYYHSGQKTRF
jgi:hypothetical protein